MFALASEFEWFFTIFQLFESVLCPWISTVTRIFPFNYDLFEIISLFNWKAIIKRLLWSIFDRFVRVNVILKMKNFLLIFVSFIKSISISDCTLDVWNLIDCNWKGCFCRYVTLNWDLTLDLSGQLCLNLDNRIKNLKSQSYLFTCI